MAMGEIFTAPVEQIVSGGAGMVRYRGKSVFMNLTAPGDLVTGRIIEENQDWAQAELLEILKPSPLRRPPFCPLYGSCGGCSLQHLSYEAQVAEKRRILREAFVRLGAFSSPPEPEIHPSPEKEYRNRVQFHRIAPSPPRRLSRPAPGAPGRLSLGFKARKSGELIPVPDCPVADPLIRRALGEGSLLPPPDKDRFTVYARGNTLAAEGGISRGRVCIRGKELLMDAGVFFQSNGTALEALIPELRKAAALASPSLAMADMYCGVGTFAAFLGDGFPRLDLVEENRQALNLARENIPQGNSRFYPQKADRWAAERGGEGKGNASYGFITVDPPRQGLSAPLRKWLVREGPPVLAYVSCEPATLARDSGELCRGGYALAQLHLFDFYPQTAHIEALAVFLR
ncbi:MAG: methyltransferase [Spirochaetaceae bacterium]|jgi:23S rRNA (uracil1939-C5)-methyltransferase|nr:methyltransferase [Spirochaetaceae bacterium]